MPVICGARHLHLQRVVRPSRHWGAGERSRCSRCSDAPNVGIQKARGSDGRGSCLRHRRACRRVGNGDKPMLVGAWLEQLQIERRRARPGCRRHGAELSRQGLARPPRGPPSCFRCWGAGGCVQPSVSCSPLLPSHGRRGAGPCSRSNCMVLRSGRALSVLCRVSGLKRTCFVRSAEHTSSGMSMAMRGSQSLGDGNSGLGRLLAVSCAPKGRAARGHRQESYRRGDFQIPALSSWT